MQKKPLGDLATLQLAQCHVACMNLINYCNGHIVEA